jgi:hypothetical protein
MIDFDKQNEIIAKYPQLFGNPKVLYGFQCDFCCGKGWLKLIDDLCCNIMKVLDAHPELSEENKILPVMQIEEKFGSLRFYICAVHESISDEIFSLIRQAECISSCTCEKCGLPGTQRYEGWVKTLCDDCDSKRA